MRAPEPRRVAALAMVAAAVACSPTLDWRELRPEGSQAHLLFPCKPASQARSVTLAGSKVEMSMFACTAANTVYALSFADVADPGRVGPALDELAAAAQAHVQASSNAASQPLFVSGMTPAPQAAQWLLKGQMPDGRAVVERLALFSRGTRVYQATMLGATLDAQAEETFFGALKLGP